MHSKILLACLAALCVIVDVARAQPFPLSTAFTYQGDLSLGGVPVNGSADFQFTLWNALNGATQIGAMVPVNAVPVISGRFMVQIDFGAPAFNGDARWLQIAARSPAGGGAFTTLAPRQPITAVPYALQTRGMFVDATGRVGIGTTNPGSLISNAKLDVAGGHVVVSSDFGFFSKSATGIGAGMDTTPGNDLALFANGAECVRVAASGNVGIGTTSPFNKFTLVGDIGVYRSNGAALVGVYPDPPSGSSTFPLGTPTMSAGSLALFGPAGTTRFGVRSRFNGTSHFPNQGELYMDGPDGTRIFSVQCVGEPAANAWVSFYRLDATVKNFRVPNPDNDEEDITYASLEGPECGMYMRGTASLVAGRARVDLPATFSSIASKEGLTVILTPLSGDSRGLACTNRSINGFDVVELMQGDGSYDFDWEIKAVRRGLRDYKVVHPWTEGAAGNGTPDELWLKRMAQIEQRNAKFKQEDLELGPRP